MFDPDRSGAVDDAAGSESGLLIQAAYDVAGSHGLDPDAMVGVPNRFPFIRACSTMPTSRPQTMRQYAVFWRWITAPERPSGSTDSAPGKDEAHERLHIGPNMEANQWRACRRTSARASHSGCHGGAQRPACRRLRHET